LASNCEQLVVELYSPVHIEDFYVVKNRTLDDEISDLIKMQRRLVDKIEELLRNNGLARKTEDLTNE